MAMSNARLFILARRVKRFQAEAAEWTTDAEKARRKVTDEMIRRRVRTITSDDGIKVTLTQGTTIIVNDAGILRDLTPAQRKKVTKVTLDRSKLSQEIQAGRIDADVLERHSSVRKNAAYPTITLPAE